MLFQSTYHHTTGRTLRKGVIRCPDIKDCTDDEILEGLKAEGVIKLDRTLVFIDGQRKPIGTFISFRARAGFCPQSAKA